MRFQVSDHLSQPLGYQAQYELREGQLYLSDDTALSDLTGSMSLLRTDRGLLVSIVATTTIRETCSRCLAPTDYHLALDFQEEYLPTVDVYTGSPLPLPADADNFLIDADFILNLDEALRQYKVLGEPAKPLCQPDCCGLCPHCGHNLNLGPCPCPQQQDSRWGALLELSEALKQREES